LKKVAPEQGFSAIETLFCSEPPDLSEFEKIQLEQGFARFSVTPVAVLPRKSQELLRKARFHAGCER
jgi:hypothetical protein